MSNHETTRGVQHWQIIQFEELTEQRYSESRIRDNSFSHGEQEGTRKSLDTSSEAERSFSFDQIAQTQRMQSSFLYLLFPTRSCQAFQASHRFIQMRGLRENLWLPAPSREIYTQRTWFLSPFIFDFMV